MGHLQIFLQKGLSLQMCSVIIQLHYIFVVNPEREEQVNVALRAAREQSGKTQAQVAKEVGIAEIAYQRYEYGTTEPRVRTAIRIADALGTTVEALFRENYTRSE